MALNNFENLKQAIERWSKKTDISDVIDDFIDLAEQKIDYRLKTRLNELTATDTTSTRFTALPAGYVQMRRVSIISGGITYEIYYKTPEAMTIQADSGRPRHFTITSQVEWDRIPDGAYTAEFSYYSKLTPLSSANPTNDVLTNYPNLYLYGSLAELYRHARDEDLAAYYDALFDKEINSANLEEDRGRYGPAPRMIYQGPTP